VLEDALVGYDGTLLLISHDRAFLNALVNRVVEVERGCLTEFVGNYDDYLRRKSAPPTASTAPAKPSQAAAAETPKGPDAPLSKRERIAARERTRERTRRHQRSVKRLAAVEEEIRECEARMEEFSWRLGDPELHRDPDAIRAIEADRAELRSAVDDLYREWERLAAEIEAAEQVLG
jgi:ATP-binding cassette subfamily F protein 3